MTAQELINTSVAPLSMTDTAQKAITWMVELHSNILPVIESGKFKGFLSENTIFEHNNLDKLVFEFQLSGEACAVNLHNHFYDVIKVASEAELKMVAVLDDKGDYVGAIIIEDTLMAFARNVAVQNPGGIIVLSIYSIDYSLSEISRLIESNNAKVLSCWVSNDVAEQGKLNLTLKINKPDLTHIIATLERFGYTVMAKFQELPAAPSNEQDRLDILLKYLSI